MATGSHPTPRRTPYDAIGDQTQTTTPAPAGQSGYEATSYTYDGNGNLIQVTAPPTSNASGAPSQVTTSTYTSTGQLATRTQWSGSTALSTVSYCYDSNGHATAVIYADGNSTATAPCNTNPAYPWIVDPTAYPAQAAAQTTYSYDSSGEMVSTTGPATAAAPAGATWSYTYGPDGENLTSTDPNGVTTTTAYTPLGQVSGVTYSCLKERGRVKGCFGRVLAA